MTKKIPKNRQNEQYWLNREKQQKAYIDKNLASDEQYNKVIQAQYDSLLADINKRIDSELSKLANENGISIADMRARVSQTDIKQFEAEAKRVVAQADKMRKQGKSPKLADWSQEVNDRLRLYNATMRINRLEYLKAGIGLDMITAGLQVDSELRDKLFKDATEEQKRQAGILGENNAHIDTLAIGNIILAKTKSNNFSQRIWTNMDVLQAKLSQTIMAGITTGQSYDEMARRLKTQVSKDIQNVTYATQRIARTEAARVQTEITMNSLKRNGYDFCKWYKEPSACHDCALIGNQDNGWGKGIYKVKDVPTIPVHPNCRCAVGAYWVDDEDNSYKEIKKHKNKDYGNSDFTKASSKQQELLNKITPALVQRIVTYINSVDFDDRKMTLYDSKAIRAALGKAHDLGYDKKPMLVENGFEEINDSSKLYRYTDRKDQLTKGNLEYSGIIKSVYGRGIYFGNNNSDIANYKRNDNYDLIKATLADNAVLIDRQAIIDKIKSIENLNAEKYKILARDHHFYGLVAMEAGADGLIIEENTAGAKIGYIVLFNRGKLVVFDE